MEIEGECAGLIVVEDRAIGKHRVANAEVEDCRVAAAVTAVECGKVGDAILIDEDLQHGIVEANAIEVPIAPEDGDDAYARLGMLYLKQRRIGVRTCAIDGETVKIDAERCEMEVEVLKTHRDAETFSGFLLQRVDQIRVTARTVYHERENYSTEQNRKDNGNGDRTVRR